jgi:hypothetical protein
LTTKQGGKVAMIQSASSLLFNRSGPACEFREKFFKTFGVEQVVNLSALRFRVFNKKKGSAQKAVAPACVVVFSPESPTGDRLLYLSPKLAEDDTDEFNIVVEPADVKEIYAEEAGGIPEIWTAFLWGNRRDWALIRHLRALGSIEKDVLPVNFRRGIEFGNRKKLLRQLEWRRILFASDFPQQALTYLQADSLPKFTDPKIHSKDSTDFGAFDTPQLVIKRSWRKTSGRFQARLVKTTGKEGVLCTQSYATVHVPDEDADILAAACLTYNSILAVYFLLLTSGRFASYRPEPLVEELLRVPIPSAASARLESVKSVSDCDEQVRQAFDFKDAEWTLVEDLFDVTLPDFKGDEASPGRQPTKRREKSAQEPQLWRYCEYFIRVLKAGFGRDKQISATIFQEKSSDLLPFRLVAFQFDQVASPSVHVESLDTPDLLTELEALNKTWLKHHKATSGNVYCQRVARIYDRRGRVPTVLILKPDACRYWTRSMGLHDADEVAADFFSWQANAGNKSKGILVEAMHFGKSTQSDTTTTASSTIKPGIKRGRPT